MTDRTALNKALESLQRWLFSAQQEGHILTTQDTIVLADETISQRICLGMVDKRMFVGLQDQESSWVAPIRWSHLSCMKSESAIFLVSHEDQGSGQTVPTFAIGFKTDHAERLSLLQRVRTVDLRQIHSDTDGVSGVAADVLHTLPVVLADGSQRGIGGYRLILEPPVRPSVPPKAVASR